MSLGIFDAWLMRCDIGTLKLEIRFHFECNMYQSESTGNFFECYWQDKNEWIFFCYKHDKIKRQVFAQI